MPSALSPWLSEAGSLTARLKRYSHHFRLQRLQEDMAVLPEFLVDMLPGTGKAQLREVLLWCDEKPCVYAQSWLPEQSLQTVSALADLGEQPLGEYLFCQPGLSRSQIEVTQLNIPQNTWCSETSCWARRSVFRLNGQSPVFVAEVFLPGVLTL